MSRSRAVRIDLGPRRYEVRIGAGMLGELGRIVHRRARAARRCLVIADAGVPLPHRREALRSLRAEGLSTWIVVLRPSERAKTMHTAEALAGAMARLGLDRSDVVVTLGGGVVGDLGGFAGAIYRRGVAVVQCPTTLLAMVDASVGGKTGVNLDIDGDLVKNAAGAFWQPIAVLADVRTLASLPERQYRAGLAECLKHGLIGTSCGDPGLLDWLLAHSRALRARQPTAITALVHRNVALKARVVEGDEREEHRRGGRALLNLGHTFGHAIETLPGVRPVLPNENRLGRIRRGGEDVILHGEAVAAGLVAAAHTAQAMDLCGPEVAAIVEAALGDLGLPAQVSGLPKDATIFRAMMRDKKVRGGRLRLILPTGVGTCRVVEDPPIWAVRRGLEAIRAER